jgi:16S rRNA (uracil1498-N3)-methyltransferase
MRIPRVYRPGPLTAGGLAALEERASTHLLRVLRLKAGAPLRVFNGEGAEFDAVIEDYERGRARLRIGEPRRVEVESPLALTLAQGISRGERMDFTLQKSVELGVTRIAPLMTAYSQVNLEGERLERRHQHWLGVIVSACEQSGRNYLPALLPAQPLRDWLAAEPNTGTGAKLVLDPDGDRRLSELEPARRVTLLIGPEGGLDAMEIKAARDAGYTSVRLGPRVLRTESAGIAALAALQALWGDLA